MEFIDQLINGFNAAEDKSFYYIGIAASVVVFALVLRSFLQAVLIIGVIIIAFYGFSIFLGKDTPNISKTISNTSSTVEDAVEDTKDESTGILDDLKEKMKDYVGESAKDLVP